MTNAGTALAWESVFCFMKSGRSHPKSNANLIAFKSSARRAALINVFLCTKADISSQLGMECLLRGRHNIEGFI